MSGIVMPAERTRCRTVAHAAFRHIPAVVEPGRAGGNHVDLFAPILADIGDVKPPVALSNEKRHGLRSPYAQISGRFPGWPQKDCPEVFCKAANAHRYAGSCQQRVEILSASERIAAAAAVAVPI
jgi:hypothetical protein